MQKNVILEEINDLIIIIERNMATLSKLDRAILVGTTPLRTDPKKLVKAGARDVLSVKTGGLSDVAQLLNDKLKTNQPIVSKDSATKLAKSFIPGQNVGSELATALGNLPKDSKAFYSYGQAKRLIERMKKRESSGELNIPGLARAKQHVANLNIVYPHFAG